MKRHRYDEYADDRIPDCLTKAEHDRLAEQRHRPVTDGTIRHHAQTVQLPDGQTGVTTVRYATTEPAE